MRERAEAQDQHDSVDDAERLSAGPEGRVAAAVGRLDALTRRLRRECPWDREQDERTIVPHTVEEAYELADAATRRDDAKLLDELGDVLFQVHFLSLLLEERGAGDMAGVAEHCRTKLIRRHPHVFGDVEAATAGEVLANWDAIKQSEPGREEGIFGEVPENLPALLLARKVQRRAASAEHEPWPAPADALAAARERLEAICAERPPAGPAGAEARDALHTAVGDALFALVGAARRLHIDPELALRAATDRFRAQHDDELPSGRMRP